MTGVQEETTSPPRGARRWRWVLAAPVLWFVYFMVVYLFAEAACHDGSARFDVAGVDGVATITVLSTVLAVGLTVPIVSSAARRVLAADATGEREGRDLDLIALLLSGCFLLAIIAVGIPALVLQPC